MRYFLFLLISLFLRFAHADAVIFSGNDVKALKYNLDLFGRSKVMGLNVDPSAGGGVAAPLGSIGMDYLTGEIYYKSGAGNTQWTSISGGLSGTPNTIVGYDSSGALYSLPSIVTSTVNNAFTINSTQQYNAVADGSPIAVKLVNHELEVNPAVSSTDQAVTNLSSDLHFDRSGTGNDFTGDLTSLSISASHEGAGTIGNLNGQFIGVSVGDGAAGTANTVTAQNMSILMRDFATAQHLYGINANINQQSGASNLDTLNLINMSTNGLHTNSSVSMISLNSDSDTTNFNGFNMTYAGDTSGSANFMSISSTGEIGNGANVFNADVQGNVTSDFSGIGLLMSGDVSGNSKLLNIQSSGEVSNDLVGAFFNLQSDANTLQGLQIGVSGDITSNANMQNLTFTGTANDVTGILLDLDGAAANDVKGVNIDVTGITSPNQKLGLSVSGGALNASSPIDTSVFTPGQFFNGNLVGGTFKVASGFPLDAAGFGNNLGFQIELEDTYQDTLSGTNIGFSINGFANQNIVAAGVNAPGPINWMSAGGQLIGSGTLGEANLFRALGLIQTGSVVVTNLYGFRYDNLLGFAPTNEWAFYNSNSNAKEYFAGQLDLDNDFTLKETGGGTDRITITRPSIAASYTLTLPPDDGSANQALITNGSGVTSWATVVRGSETQEQPSGTVNGVNTSFTLAGTPISNASVLLSLDGLTLTQGGGNDYTISGATITMAVAPSTGQKLWVKYNQ